MSRIEQLRQIVSQFDLNKHPFYTDWRAGTLPMSKLARYAQDYGRFVGLIADGWERVGRSDYAEEERMHHELWDKFTGAVRQQTNGSSPSNAALPETCELIETVRTAFASEATALGGLYAFELQQPDTAQVKLDGLREHYAISEDGHEYFVEHAGKWHEVEALEEKLAVLDDAGFERAKSACSAVSDAMWRTLDGIYGHA